MPPFVPWGLLSLNIYIVVVRRRRKRRGGDYRASACDAVISITRSAPFGDLHHTQCVFFYKKLQGEWDSMTSVTTSLVNDILIAENRDIAQADKGLRISGRRENIGRVRRRCVGHTSNRVGSSRGISS